jgi:hypothetical protein
LAGLTTAIDDLARQLDAPGSTGPEDPARQSAGPRRIDLDPDGVARGLGQLVLTIVELLRQLMERQAIRRLEAGSLTEEQEERLGLTLMRLAERMGQLKAEFGLSDDDLNLDLGPLGRLL